MSEAQHTAALRPEKGGGPPTAATPVVGRRFALPNAGVVAGLAAIVGLALLLRIQFFGTTIDDAYITFRYSRNLSNGLGLVYNPGERVFGSTTPLFALVLALARVLGADIIVTAKVLGLAASCLSVVLVFLLLERHVGRVLALLGSLLVALSTDNIAYAALGMETPIYEMLILLLFLLYRERRLIACGVAAGILALLRPDGLIAVGIVGAALLYQYRAEPRRLLVPAVVSVGIVAPWVLFATLYYGSPVPSSLAAKSATYQIPVRDAAAYLTAMFGFGWPPHPGPGLAMGLFFGIGAAFMLASRHVLLVAPAWVLTYAIVFTLTGVRFYQGWYTPPLWPPYLAVAVFGLHAGATGISRWLPRFSPQARRRSVLALSVAAFAVIAAAGAPRVAGNLLRAGPDPGAAFEERVSRPIGLWLAEHADKDSKVALQSIGAVGWYSDRYIVDEGGLITPQVVALNAAQGRGAHAFFDVLQTFRPEYYVAFDQWELGTLLFKPEQRQWFFDQYCFVEKYSHESTWFLFVRRDVHARTWQHSTGSGPSCRPLPWPPP